MDNDALIWNAWSPAIDSIGFIAMPLNVCAKAIAAWRASLPQGKRGVRVFDGKWDFPKKMAILNEIAVETPTVELLSSTRSPQWTAYFDNGLCGADRAPLSALAKIMRTTVVNVQYQPSLSDEDPRWGNCQFSLFYPPPRGGSRSIALIEDEPGWIFAQAGDPEPWEHIDAYSRRKKVDRFTRSMLVEYCHNLGIDPFNPNFYTDETAMIETRPPWPVTRLTRAQLAASGWVVGG